MEHKETGCQAPPEAPTLCANNCGFFGSAATMNLCSKCHKDLVMKQEQAKLAASSFGSIMNGSSSGSAQETAAPAIVDVLPGPTLASVMPKEQPRAEEVPCVFALKEHSDVKVKGPSRCATCRKRVGLTGFNCRCGNLFCASHRYSDKHDCPFDYRTAGRDAIAKANPVVKADKLDKI